MTDETSQSRPLSAKQEMFVAAYVGAAKGSATEAARIAGYKQPRMHGSRLMTNDDIKAAIDAHLAEIKAEGIALKQNRIDAGVDRARRLHSIVTEREGWFAQHEPAVPGGRSGYLVRRVKKVQHTFEPNPDDPDSRASVEIAEVVEYEVDTGLLKEQRELEKQIAQERGEWVEKGELGIGGQGGGPVRFVFEEFVPPAAKDKDGAP